MDNVDWLLMYYVNCKVRKPYQRTQLYLGMTKEFTMVMYYLDNGQRSYKLQTKHAERMILPSSSRKY